MKKIFVTTVKIAVVAEDATEACSATSMALSENLMLSKAILDWGYVDAHPFKAVCSEDLFKNMGEFKPDEYYEGDLMRYK